jgi:hypothetical protein
METGLVQMVRGGKDEWDGYLLVFHNIVREESANTDFCDYIKVNPLHKFYVIKDPYKKAINLVSLGDLRQYLRGYWFFVHNNNSYESFTKNNILFSAYSLRDCMWWMIENLAEDGAKEIVETRIHQDNEKVSEDEWFFDWDKEKMKSISGYEFSTENPAEFVQYLHGDSKDSNWIYSSSSQKYSNTYLAEFITSENCMQVADTKNSMEFEYQDKIDEVAEFKKLMGL